METAKTKSARKWYVLRTFSGHEKKVKEYLEQELERLDMIEKLPQIMIPTETVFEMRGGKKRTRGEKLLSGLYPAACSARQRTQARALWRSFRGWVFDNWR